MTFKTLIVINLVLILISLAAGVLFLRTDGKEDTRVVTSLTVRVILSISLFVLLLVGYALGYIEPHGIS